MFEEMKKKLTATLKVVEEDLGMIKTGRAKPQLIERVMVEAYDGAGKMPLVELANISAPDTSMLTVQAWDQTIVKKILSALAASDLHLNPVLDGNLIRISFPPLTEERRLELVKMVKQKIEGGKEMMRDVRNDTKKMVDGKKGQPDVSEDDISRWLDEMQDEYESFVKQLEEMGEQKEKELMEM